MSSGERPIGAAKGKQSDTEALCQPHPPADFVNTLRRSKGSWSENMAITLVVCLIRVDLKESEILNRRTLLHVHTRTDMRGALCDLLAPPPPPPPPYGGCETRQPKVATQSRRCGRVMQAVGHCLWREPRPNPPPRRP